MTQCPINDKPKSWSEKIKSPQKATARTEEASVKSFLTSSSSSCCNHQLCQSKDFFFSMQLRTFQEPFRKAYLNDKELCFLKKQIRKELDCFCSQKIEKLMRGCVVLIHKSCVSVFAMWLYGWFQTLWGLKKGQNKTFCVVKKSQIYLDKSYQISINVVYTRFQTFCKYKLCCRNFYFFPSWGWNCYKNRKENILYEYDTDIC